MPASTERLPLRQMSSTGGHSPTGQLSPPSRSFRTSRTKSGLIVQSGSSIHAMCTAPTGCPTKRYSMVERTSMSTAAGLDCSSAQASGGLMCRRRERGSCAAMARSFRAAGAGPGSTA